MDESAHPLTQLALARIEIAQLKELNRSAGVFAAELLTKAVDDTIAADARASEAESRCAVLERWVIRARCGCTQADCFVHGSWTPDDVEGVEALCEKTYDRGRR